MATSSSSNLMLECPVCLDSYKDPRVLPCGHTFCRYCLERTLESGQLNCPKCRVFHAVQIADLPVNYVVKEIQATDNNFQYSSSTIKMTEEDIEKRLQEIDKVVMCLAFHDAVANVLNDLRQNALKATGDIDMEVLDNIRGFVKSGTAEQSLMNGIMRAIVNPSDVINMAAQQNIVFERIKKICEEICNSNVISALESTEKERKFIATAYATAMRHGMDEGADKYANCVLSELCQYKTILPSCVCVIGDSSFILRCKYQTPYYIWLESILGKRVAIFGSCRNFMTKVKENFVTKILGTSKIEMYIQKKLIPFRNKRCSPKELGDLRERLGQKYPPDVWNCTAIDKGKAMTMKYQPKEMEDKLLLFCRDTKLQSFMFWTWIN